jgi:DnaB-like helicase C terminal domain
MSGEPMRDNSKALETVVADWLAAVVSSAEGWEVKRNTYRKGVTVELDALFSWVDRCYGTSGELPDYETMKQRWPHVPWPVKPLTEPFAVLQLDEAYRRYDLIQHARGLDALLTDGTTTQAWDHAVSFSSKSLSGNTARGISIDDPSLYVENNGDDLYLFSWGPVMEEKPLRASDLALITARTTVGKSWLLLMAAVDAVQQGWDVVMYSLEMPAAQMAKRLKMLVGKPVKQWMDGQPGSIIVIDQTMSRHGFTAKDIMRRVDKESRTLVVVDYGELVRPESGGRATEGWNKSAEISQSLQNAAKYLCVPMLVAVQDNRASVVGRPGVESISGSDQWGRDADIVVRLRDEAGTEAVLSSTRVLEGLKSRHTGARPVSYFHFDPDGGGIRAVDQMEYAAINGRNAG